MEGIRTTVKYIPLQTHPRFCHVEIAIPWRKRVHLILDRREEHVTLMLGLSAQRNIFTSIYLELSEIMHIFAVELLSIRYDDK